MINLRTLFAVGFMAVLTSCGTTQDVTADKQAGTRGRSNQEITTGRTKTTTSPEFSSERTVTSTTTRNDDARYKANLKNMYSSLNMNEDQIKRFENEWGSSTSAWKRSNRNKTMNSFERTEYQDRILKGILDETQFEAYREWARENPMTD